MDLSTFTIVQGVKATINLMRIARSAHVVFPCGTMRPVSEPQNIRLESGTLRCDCSVCSRVPSSVGEEEKRLIRRESKQKKKYECKTLRLDVAGLVNATSTEADIIPSHAFLILDEAKEFLTHPKSDDGPGDEALRYKASLMSEAILETGIASLTDLLERLEGKVVTFLRRPLSLDSESDSEEEVEDGKWREWLREALVPKWQGIPIGPVIVYDRVET